ncbi:MAG: tetratricopeptide repeat protein [Bacteroidota bacterium]
MAILRFLLFFCLGNLYFVFSYAGQPSSFADSINKILKKNKGTDKQIEFLLSTASKLQSNTPDEALICANQALSMANSADYPELKLKAMNSIGFIKVVKAEFASGLEMALKAKDLATELKDDNAHGEASLIIGTIKLFQGNYSESLKNNFTALRLFEKTNYSQGILKARNGIGNVCYYQQDLDKAYYYYSSALNIAKTIKDTAQIAFMLNNIGLVLNSKGRYNQAIECYQKAILINSKLGLKLRLASNYMNLGSVYKALKRSEDFVRYYNKAVEIYKIIGSNYELCWCYLQFASYYLKVNDQSNLLKYAMISYNEGKRYDFRDAVLMTSSMLHDYYYKAGNIDSAYKYAMIRNAANDSIKRDQSIANLRILEMEYNYEKVSKEEKLKQQKQNFINIVLFILAISGLIIAILFLSRQIVKTKNIRLEKQYLADEVEFKNKELTLNVMSLIKKSELIVDISNRLIEMEQNSTENATKSAILQIVNSLQRNSNNDIWEEFEVRFRQVHNNFYEKLLTRFPELSPSELKLCALLRLNLSTKEICELTGQLPASLDMARYRLRKKLSLTDSTINLVTFLSLI